MGAWAILEAAPREGRMSTLTDRELLEAVLERRESAWRELLRRYHRLLVRCIDRAASGALSTDADRQEILGDVCLQLWRNDLRKLRQFDPTRGVKLSTWLGLVATHAAYDYLRAARRRPLLDRVDGAIEPSAESTAFEEVVEKERWRALYDLLGDCSARERRFVELYFERGLPPEAVAAEMHISVKTVYSKKNKLRAKLVALSKRATMPLAA